MVPLFSVSKSRSRGKQSEGRGADGRGQLDGQRDGGRTAGGSLTIGPLPPRAGEQSPLKARCLAHDGYTKPFVAYSCTPPSREFILQCCRRPARVQTSAPAQLERKPKPTFMAPMYPTVVLTSSQTGFARAQGYPVSPPWASNLDRLQPEPLSTARDHTLCPRPRHPISPSSACHLPNQCQYSNQYSNSWMGPVGAGVPGYGVTICEHVRPLRTPSSGFGRITANSAGGRPIWPAHPQFGRGWCNLGGWPGQYNRLCEACSGRAFGRSFVWDLGGFLNL